MAQERKLLPFSDRARFERSDEWQHIIGLMNGFEADLVSICLDRQTDLDDIRYAQGGIDAIRWCREITSLVFEDENDGSSNKQ